MDGRSAGRTGKGKLFFVFVSHERTPVKQLHQFVKGSPLAFGKKLFFYGHRRQDSHTLQTEIAFFRKFQFSVFVLHAGLLHPIS